MEGGALGDGLSAPRNLMARLVSVLVLKPLEHQGRSYVRGETVSLSPITAAALGRSGHVTLTKGARVDPVVKDLQAEPPRRRGRRNTYRRKDIVPEEQKA